MSLRSKLRLGHLDGINWVAILGWLLFIAIVVLNETGLLIFNPLIFGAGYYVFYVLLHLANEEERNVLNLCLMVSKQNQKIIGLSVVALFFMWTDLDRTINEKDFAKEVSQTCVRMSHQHNDQTSQLCEEVSSLMNSRLNIYP